MAQPREVGFNPSSPRSSSGGADSYKHEGTPDTRLTAFSPEESSVKSTKMLKSTSLASLESQPVLFPVKTVNSYLVPALPSGEKDPFISNTIAPKPEQKLSPTASAFRPYSEPIVVHGSGDGNSVIAKPSTVAQQEQPLVPISPLFSVDLRLSRDLCITSGSGLLTEHDIRIFFGALERDGSQWQGTQSIHASTDGIHVHFSDIRDALLVQRSAAIGGEDWEACFMLSMACSQAAQFSPRTEGLRHGRVAAHATFSPSAIRNVESVEAVIGSVLQAEGAVFAYKRLIFNNGIWLALLEYCDYNCARNVVVKRRSYDIDGLHISVFADNLNSGNGHSGELSTPLPSSPSSSAANELSMSFSSLSLPKTQTYRTPPVTPNRQAPSSAGYQIIPQLAMYPAHQSQFPPGPQYVLGQFPIRGPTTTPLAGNFSLLGSLYPDTASAALVPIHADLSPQRMSPGYGSPNGRRQNAMRISRSPYYNAATHHNHVDVSRIREGVDVRTTIMLRNIPNKVDQAMLKRIIDESSWGKYDFMYLRIDFANDCNVGYAFINFVDPLDIIDFVNARGNQRWNCFKSDKVAEISYATIQGKDCLVQKFRNSSVMLEAPHYRPKLYFTSNGPRPELAGDEEPFPEPDNQSKMKRSCENAEHVGLFTPNAGQHFRDEQRRRRSQYDRGTRLAALEEYDFDTHLFQG